VHAAQHRSLRELFAFTRQLQSHWSSLGPRVGGPEGDLLTEGAGVADELLCALPPVTAARGVKVAGAAAMASRGARARPLADDRLLERNQAFRFALGDVQHVVTLLGFLAKLAATDEDDELRRFCSAWERRFRDVERRARAAAIDMGNRPDQAITPAVPGVTGRAGAGISYGIGTVGELVDKVTGRRHS
jgi:hypothetical protein